MSIQTNKLKPMIMRVLGILILQLVLCYSVIAQQSSRDVIKIGGGYNLVTLEDAFIPMAYVEYTRTFYPPITIGISANYSTADDIKTVFENRELTTFSFDLLAYYSFLETSSAHDMKIGFMITSRSYLIKWENINDGMTGKNRLFKPGLGIILNYDVAFSDVFLMGIKGSMAQYNNKSSVFLIGLHAGVMF